MESLNGFNWKGFPRSSNPWGGTHSTIPGCSNPWPTWPWTIPGMGLPKLLWEFHSRASPPSHGEIYSQYPIFHSEAVVVGFPISGAEQLQEQFKDSKGSIQLRSKEIRPSEIPAVEGSVEKICSETSDLLPSFFFSMDLFTWPSQMRLEFPFLRWIFWSDKFRGWCSLSFSCIFNSIFKQDTLRSPLSRMDY